MKNDNSSKQFPSPLPTDLRVLDQTHPQAGKIFWTEGCASTMDLALDLVHQGVMSPGDLLLTGFQSQGRGRHPQKSWVCQPGKGFLSTLVLPKTQIQEPLALRVGLSVCRLIEEHLGLPTQLKWPNDVLVYGKKIAGILIETRSDLLLIGVGINLSGTPDPKGTSIEEALKTQDIIHPDDLAPRYLKLLAQGLTDPDWRSSVRFRLAYRNSLVSLYDSRNDSDPGPGVRGYLKDIDEDGAVLLSLESGIQLKITSGSLRPVVEP